MTLAINLARPALLCPRLGPRPMPPPEAQPPTFVSGILRQPVESVDSTLTNLVRNALDAARVAGADGAPEVGRAGLLALERLCESHLESRSTNGSFSLLW